MLTITKASLGEAGRGCEEGRWGGMVSIMGIELWVLFNNHQSKWNMIFFHFEFIIVYYPWNQQGEPNVLSSFISCP